MHLFSTTLYEAGLYSGYTDWHSHILPGVDDGVKTMDESLAILNKYEEMGVKEVWLTPPYNGRHSQHAREIAFPFRRVADGLQRIGIPASRSGEYARFAI